MAFQSTAWWIRCLGVPKLSNRGNSLYAMTPLTIDNYVLTLSGDLVVQFFGAPLQIDNYQFTHTIQVLPNPNAYDNGTSWPCTDLDDGRTLELRDPIAAIASFDGVMVCDYSCLGCIVLQCCAVLDANDIGSP